MAEDPGVGDATVENKNLKVYLYYSMSIRGGVVATGR